MEIVLYLMLKVLLLENNLISELPSFLGSLPLLKTLTLRYFPFDKTNVIYAYSVLTMINKAEHDLLSTKSCSGRWLQVRVYVDFLMFKKQLENFLEVVFCKNQFRKILHYLALSSVLPPVKCWKGRSKFLYFFRTVKIFYQKPLKHEKRELFSETD